MKEISFKTDILPLKDKLFRLALRITRDREEAKDMVQETMLRLWNKRGEWGEIDNLEAFAMRICRNLSLDVIEKKDHHNDSLNETLHDKEDSSLTPDEKVENTERMDMTMRIINALPEKQRTVIQMRDIDEMTYKEIAEVMQITEADVKVTLFRAREKMRMSLSELLKENNQK